MFSIQVRGGSFGHIWSSSVKFSINKAQQKAFFCKEQRKVCQTVLDGPFPTMQAAGYSLEQGSEYILNSWLMWPQFPGSSSIRGIHFAVGVPSVELHTQFPKHNF